MFHSGDLQSGISLAIQQQKLVACLIADSSATSTEWEEEWLTDLEEVVTEKAVLLRMEYGGKEAGFLSAFCTIEKAPTFVVIQNGRVLAKLEDGVSRDEFVERLLAALGLGEDLEEEDGKMDIGDDPASTDVAQAASALASAVLPQSAASTLSNALQPSESTPSSLFPDRAAKLEADKQQRDAAENAARKARQDARKREAEDAYAHHRSDKGKGKMPATEEVSQDRKARDSYLAQQKKRNEEAKADRARILAQIEADKANRKARSAQARQQEGEATESQMPQSRVAEMRRFAGAGGSCQLLIRLFDGSSVRGRFPVDATIAKGVRDWIREQAPAGSGGADIPFTFRQILAPKPSRSIEVSEEHTTLQDLGLTPNATLVLVPVAGSVSAYADSQSSWWPTSVLSSAYSYLPDVNYYLPSFSRLYMGGTGDDQEPSNTQGAAMAGADSNATGGLAGVGRTRTFFDQRAEAEKEDKRTEFYNGNSSAFESRKDDDDKKRQDGKTE